MACAWIFSTPEYVAAGSANPTVLIIRFKVSTWLPVLLKPRILVADSVMLLPAANGLAPVNATNAPPLTLPDTLDEGILSLAPSVRAAAALVKYAYVVAVPTLGLSVQLVVTVITELPVAVPLGTRVTVSYTHLTLPTICSV